jgi:hypothetical protein
MVFSVSLSFTKTPAAKADNWAGWDAINTIYYNPAQEDAHNTFLATAASELETYLEQMSGRSWTVVTNTPPAVPAVYLAVNATMLGAHGDEAFRLVIDNNGVTITGKTAIAVRWGAYYLLDEKLGVRWFFRNTAWTVVPGSLSDPGALDVVDEPDYYWRFIAAPCYIGQANYADWIMHNRAIGAEYYTVAHSYGAILDYATHWYQMTPQQKQDYYNAHPTYFLPNNRYPSYPWQLNPESADVVSMAIQYARNTLNSVSNAGGQYNDAYHYGAVPITPNDGSGESFDPPYARNNIQLITDKVFGLANAVAANISADFPGKYIGVYDYTAYSGVPSIALEPNILAVVTSTYNESDLSNRERLEGLLGKGIQVGWYDYVDVWSWWQDSPGISYDLLNLVKWLSDEGVTWYDGETTDSWGARGLNYYILSKLLWDSDLDVDDLLDDFYTKAFGPASSAMQKYYNLIDTDSASLAQSFNYLSQAETLAAGNSAVLERIRQLEYYTRFLWKWHNVGITHLSLADLESFYTFVCKCRDTYMNNYTEAEAALRAELINNRGLTTAQVNALQNFTPPTTGQAAAWLSEAMSAFSGYLTIPEYVNPRRIDLKALGDTVTPAVTPLYGNTRDILVYSSGNENVTIRAKTDLQFSIGWYNPLGMLIDEWVQNGACDWTSHNFTAIEPGNYVLHVNRWTTLVSQYTYVDVPNRPASIIVDPHNGNVRTEKDTIIHNAPEFVGTNSQYFYVPAGTPNFTFCATVTAALNHVSGSLLDSNNVSHSFNWSTDNEMTLNNPPAGLWKLTINYNPNFNYFWFRGIPPLVWHDPEYLLVQAAGSATPGQPAGDSDINSDGVVNVLDIIGIAQHWGETGANGWIPEDVNNDGTIDVLDITIVGQNWTG